ncbi:C40 family peptidase [Streptomyces hydrogenans]|uniref:Glycoside hydrolase n=1 Tax=Streptomyces hydrogenans TaxID=1873719 RepID=A0ABQ3P176_9ACTN|nr:C40 family peptidase [Streptomyces hydrogenans]GHG27995.1 glycoside hydrolase [Streptomyces hydrogenans]GHI18774.1 glycoside hydrolase [Streptomyces hydrogenans]
MSHTAHIPSHRKPRRSASKLALRAGVAGGVLSTIAVAGAAGPASAEPVTETIEMPTLGSLGTDLSSAVAASAEASQQEALDQSLEAQEAAALQTAAKEAKKAKAEADRKAEAERAEKARQEAEAKAERERAEAEARASRDSARTQLSTTSASSDSGSGSGSSNDSGSSAGSSSESTQVSSGTAASIVAFARAQVGDAYVTGGTGPNSWDCSGLVQAAYAAAGIDLPRISYQQSSMGTSVSLSNLQPGDVLYWGSRSGSYHVAIYVGGGKYVGAQNSSTGVVERSLDWDPPSGAVRLL